MPPAPPSPKGDRDGVLKALGVIGVLALVYGVAQPGLLRIFHVRGGEDLKVADVLSVLLAVLGLVAASVGVLIYAVVKDRLSAETERKQELDIARVRYHTWTYAADEAWNRLEPLLIVPLTDPSRRAQCVRAIDSGVAAWGNAQIRLDQFDPTAVNQKKKIDLNLAFFLACRVYVTRVDSQNSNAARARRLVPDAPPEYNNETDALEALEAMAWVGLMCNHPGSQERYAAWLRAIEVETKSPDLLRRLRYQAAFGSNVFPPSPVQI